MNKLFFALPCMLAMLATSVFAQPDPMYPASSYNEKVPSPANFLGYELGSDLTEHHQMVGYIHEVKSAAPDRVKVEEVGTSQEGRPIYLVYVSSPNNIQRLEEHRQAVARLKDPVNTSLTEARSIASSAPVITWMNYANDGEESAAFEAGMQAVYHFAAANDPQSMETLESSIIVINTAHNPDAHQRHVVWMKAMKVGPDGTADPNAAEHQGDWLMSTSDTHYHIDSNRDGFGLTQKESRITASQMRRWSPQVWVDYHGEPEEYFFAPYAIPVNPNYPQTTPGWAEVIGRGNAEAFDRYGWTYYAREVFDLHYPGYWDSYPAFNGAIGMTYETNGGGDKGFRYRKADGTIATLRNAIAHHVVATVATAQTAAANREKLLMDYHNFFRQAMQEVQEEPLKQVALLPGNRPGDTEDLVGLLLEHEIEVYRLGQQSTVEGQSYLDGQQSRIQLPAGTYIVPMAQPNKRLAKVLLERNVEIQPEFLEEARAAHDYNKSVGENAPKKRLGFYDVTAWSLPLTYGIETYGLNRAISGNLNKVESKPRSGGGVVGDREANYAYLFSSGTNNGASLMSRLMMEDYRVAVATEPFVKDGKEYRRGTIVVRVERNPASLHERLRKLAAETGTKVEPVDAAWTEKGIMLGSRNVVNLKKPRVMVLMDEPVRGRSYGALWFNLEQRYGVDFTALRVQDFNDVDLHEYDVIVMPPGSSSGYERMLGEKGISSLKAWIEAGGTFVGIKEGAVFAADPDVNLTSSRLLGSEGEEKVHIDATPGAIMRVKLDSQHFLSLGYNDQIPVHVNSSYIFTPSKKGANVGIYEDEPRVSGFVFDDNIKNFPGNAYLIHEPMGRGNVVLFAEQPVFRLYWRGLERLFMNSVLLAPSF